MSKIKVGEHIKIVPGYPFNSRKFNNEGEGKPIIRIRNLLGSKTDTFYSGEYSSEYVIRKGDILIGMDGDFHIIKWNNTIEALLNQRIMKIDQKFGTQIDIDYFFYFLQPFLKKVSDKIMATTVKHLSTYDISDAEVIFPSLQTQSKIAKILSTCDAVIEQTQLAIDKYKAIKEGMLTDLFTRGIDVKTGKLRATVEEAPELYKGSELGWIPKEWEVERLEDVCIDSLSYGINAAAVEYSYDLPKYLRITDIDEDGWFIEDSKKSVNASNYSSYIIENNDIVFARTGASVGKTYLYNENDGVLVFAGFLIKASLNPNIINSKFFKFFTETSYYRNWVEIMSLRSAQPGINGQEYSGLQFPFPNIKEQDLIAEKLDVMNLKLHSEQSYLEKLQEIKKGLMEDLLSVKVGV